ncbi:hypothetical protein BRC87_00375 [Halobacteriales archaeon QS_4_66_20]|nr:MAG: hypothetical protein BRC87_00375 [Halobacteriales archaeon QS_4_66_20]
MTNQQTQADKATGQTFGQKPDSDAAAAALLDGVADAAASALAEEEVATIDAVATYLYEQAQPAVDTATGSPANRARQAAKQLRLAAADERVGELGEVYLLSLADSSEQIATRLPDDHHPDAGGEQA